MPRNVCPGDAAEGLVRLECAPTRGCPRTVRHGPGNVSICMKFWGPHNLPQIYIVIVYNCIGKVAGFAVYICGNLWGQYLRNLLSIYSVRYNPHGFYKRRTIRNQCARMNVSLERGRSLSLFFYKKQMH